MKQIFNIIAAWVMKYKNNIIPILVSILIFIGGVVLVRYDFSKKSSYEPKSPEEVTLEDTANSFLEAGSLGLKESNVDADVALKNNADSTKTSNKSVGESKMTFNALCVSPEKELTVSKGTKVVFENTKGDTKNIKVLETIYSIPQYKYRTYTFRNTGAFEVSCDGINVGTIVVQ